MLTADQIIARLGGPAALASEIDVPLTTVCSWGTVNFIPEWRRPALLMLAKKKGEAIGAADFPTVEQRKSRGREAA
jgi:hypothetical protein